MNLYYNEDKSAVAVLVSPGYGAGWSTWGDKELAYDEDVVKFWLSKRDDKEWLKTCARYEVKGSDGRVRFPASEAYKEAMNFFSSIGYDHPCMLGFENIRLVWVPTGRYFRINEYDGAESVVYMDEEGYVKFE